ncbi:hypothetical protein [Hominenteromicrobium sp.]|uniref:hypothetical protein n=1 Tax=Hominenteromicrobium sp. TaxID=3073581 RepID=UPI003AB7961B
MAYIRKRSDELTGYQEHADFRPSIDLQCDFVMVYGLDKSMPERIRNFRTSGYVVHLMTGVSWGEYQIYLNGEWDGREHWDEGQTERSGKKIIHNPTVPYMVPSVSFADFLTDRLKIAVDAGVEAIHMEEPEFWDRGGYSEAFKREYELYYREKWQPPHTSLDVRYKASKLKAYLYARTLSRISASLKEYAMVKYGRVLRFYVPTHSLLNYTQWKIMSPEAALIDIPTVDGYIAQIWTGTSRSANVYAGVYRERTFETAFLEYGIMQELVKGTGRRMWFLHDPIEDCPAYTWDNFRYNYLKTAAASLLHPAVYHYEICPWPSRVFDGAYPRYQPNIADKDETSYTTDQSKPIPQSYATLLSGMVQMFGDMEQADCRFEGVNTGVGLLMSDSGLFQRSFPDGIVQNGLGDRLEKVMHANTEALAGLEDSKQLSAEIEKDPDLLLDFIQSAAFPNFFGMALPLLKYGLPVRPVQLDNVRRFAGYLGDYANLILSYEYIKPETPDVNAALAAFVRSGGTLFYIGDGSDPYHKIDSWWRRAGYENPACHLFEMLGLPKDTKGGVHLIGDGKVCCMDIAPAKLCLSAENAASYRDFVRDVLKMDKTDWQYKNDLTLHRGPYIISAVMDESISEEPKVFRGLYADMLENDYKVITEKTVYPDENTVLYDFSKIEQEDICVIGCSARIFEMNVTESEAVLCVKAADKIHAFLRIRLPRAAQCVCAQDEMGEAVDVDFTWEEMSRTVLLSYESADRLVTIKVKF